MPLLEARGLTKTYALSRGRRLRALLEVSLTLEAGEIVGLVGESGCGKTTLGRCLLRLVEPTAGRVFFEGEDLTALGRRALRARRRRLQMIFQDPFLSLDPRMTAGAIVEEPLRIFGVARRTSELRERVVSLLEQVGLEAGAADRYPHEFSGGQRQRIGIARALAAEPALIVADEPVSALDVSVQAQILNLLADLKQQRGLSYLVITHDLRVVRRLCDRVLVMYLGRIVEQGPASVAAEGGRHPYTVALASAVPRVDPRAPTRVRLVLPGEPPSPADPPPGCPFHPRCPRFASSGNPACLAQDPPLREVGPGHRVACHEVPAVTETVAGGSRDG